jgi:hypothetical protein
MTTRIWNDEFGLLTFEWVMLFALLVIGIVGGVSAIRDALIIEASDTAGAIVTLQQSYTISGSGGVTISDMSITNGEKVEKLNGLPSSYTDKAGQVDAEAAQGAGGSSNGDSGNSGGDNGGSGGGNGGNGPNDNEGNDANDDGD